jgi:hypothetical protein
MGDACIRDSKRSARELVGIRHQLRRGHESQFPARCGQRSTGGRATRSGRSRRS